MVSGQYKYLLRFEILFSENYFRKADSTNACNDLNYFYKSKSFLLHGEPHVAEIN